MKVRRRSLVASFVVVACVGVGAPAVATTEPEADVVAPLTGLPVDNAALIRRPALVIPIDNWGEQGPHAGLDQGDGMFRSDEFGNRAPHNLYANTSALFWLAGESGPVVPQFSYLPDGEEVDGPW